MPSLAQYAKSFLALFGKATPFSPIDAAHSVPRRIQELVPEDDVGLATVEPVTGVVTRAVKPSNNSTFTCHAFSKNGGFLVTGESNGIVRLWDTSEYKSVSCWSVGFGSPVSAVSFFRGDSDHVIAVDKSGSLRDFFVIPDNDVSCDGRATVQRPIIHHNVGSDENLGDHPAALMHQFSSDGDVLISTVHTRDESGFGDTVVNVTKIAEDDCTEASITLSNASTCVPILSENGKSLLLLCPPRQASDSPNSPREGSRPTGIWLVPDLDAEKDFNRKSLVQGDYASWGRMGQYLLVWSTGQDGQELKVYETKQFRPNAFRAPDPIAGRKLTHGLPRCMAKMFDEQPDGSGITVMICESGEDKNIFSVWDIEQNTVTKEVKMILSPGRSVADKPQQMFKKKILRGRSRHPPTAEKEFIETVLWKAFPDVCGVADKNWFGAVSWEYQTINLSSASSGVTAWVSEFADELVETPMSMPSEVMFDPAGSHLLLIGERVIQAFAPSFLDEHFKVGRHIEELDQKLTFLDDEERRDKLLDAYRRLHSKALARAWEIGMSAKGRSLAWFRRLREVYKGETVIDAGLSPDDKLLALILRDFRGSLYASVRTAGFTSSQGQDAREELEFPIPVEGRDHKFSPERVFLFKTLDEEDCMAFVSTEKDPVAVFCSVSGRLEEVVRLHMSTCLKICKNAEASNVLLLDNEGVCFLSLTQRRIIDRVPYRADLAGLMDDVRGALKRYARFGRGDEELPNDCGISADGDLSLLAWDVVNKKSIVVSPTTRQEECRKNIQESARSLSVFCSLSPTGKFTAFLNVDDLSQGRLTIGIFSEAEQRITFHVEVDQNLPKNMPSERQQKVLANVFYGFGDEEKELIVNTVGVSSSYSVHSASDISSRSIPTLERDLTLSRPERGYFGSMPLLKDRMNVFQIRQDVRCISNQDLLSLVNGITNEYLVERLRMSLGVSMFNLPLATNRTVFQDALVNGKNGMKSRIIDLALKQGIKLALEWEIPAEQTPSTERVSNRRLSVRRTRPGAASPVARPLPPAVKPRESTDLLKEALETNRTNDIKEAVQLVCSDIASFVSSARIMKKSFRELLKIESSILEEILWGDILLCEVCDLDVHVDFMNPRLRREDAVHINTTDSYLAWSEVSEQDVLNELWRSKNADEIQKMENEGNISTTNARLVFVRIKDAAKAGMRGIIRPLLLAQVPVHVFETEAVKMVIQYKWCHIWRWRSLLGLLKYAFFVTVFTFYAVLVVAPSDFSIGFSFREFFNCSLALAVYCSGWQMMFIQCRQTLTIAIGNRKYYLSFAKGLSRSFLTKGHTIDILSSTLLSGVIPSLHFLTLFHAEFEKLFALFVAMESILVYTKIWYYVRPFQVTGSVAAMMNSIVGECVSSLGLALLYPLGFGVALFILFSHAEKKGDPENAGKLAYTTGSEEFQNFPKSLLTMFYAFLGSFEPDTYPTDGGWWSWMISIVFVTYLLVQSLLLLNIVLAIMGDAYNKAKLSEEAFFLFRKAQYMDDLEAELTEKQIKELDSEAGKYVCKLVYLDGMDHDEQELSGRMNMIETCVRKSLQDWGESIEQTFQRNMEGVEVKCTRINEPIEELLERVERMEARSSANADRMEKMRGEIATMRTENATLIEEMRREITATSRENADRMEEMRRENIERMERIVALFHDRRLDPDVQP